MALKLLHQPELFQGQHRASNQPYFEGWYFKQVSADGSFVLSLIPGVSYNAQDPHAFIQVILGPQHQTFYIRFPLNEFHFSNAPFSVSIGENKFSLEGVKIHLHNTGLHLEGEFTFLNPTSIHRYFLQPTIMGPLTYLPKMECYHGVLSMNHGLQGTVKINHQLVDFTSGKGYIEKDWGTSFPSAYVWIQSNHFEDPTASIVLSIATLPYLGQTFKGFFLNFQWQGKEIRMATYTFAKITRQTIVPPVAQFTFKQKSFTIEMEVEQIGSASGALAAPNKGQMSNTIKEGLTGTVKLKVYQRNHLIFEGLSHHSGIEFVNSSTLKE